MIGIYKFEYQPCDNIFLSGIFTATEKEIERLYKEGVDLGECLGKHSHVYFEPGELEEYLHLVTTSQNSVIIFNNENMHTGFDLTLYLKDED